MTPLVEDGLRIVALCPAYNEEADIARTIKSLLSQTRKIDEIVVVPNGCVDRTAEIARTFPVTVLELPRMEHKKAQALNEAWNAHAQDADIVIGIDGDSELPPHAAGDWEAEFRRYPRLGGSSSQVVMTGSGFLPRMQRAEFAKSAVISVRRGSATVVSGTGCAFRGDALREASRIPGQRGPWAYDSVVEDYYLTYRLREMGWLTVVSPTVWCRTGSMHTLKALWHQRIKWQVGTVHDLARFGVTRTNWLEWTHQFFSLLCIAFWVLWMTLEGTQIATDTWHPQYSWLAFPVFFSLIEMYWATKIHEQERDWKDFALAASLIYVYIYSFLSMGWNAVSWWKLIVGGKGSKGDLWDSQYAADGTDARELEGSFS
jgi:biofilm PGA synthesis N-glycosyltransferase PgaC